MAYRLHTVGIIVEYNPLHNGHVYHFEQAKFMTKAEAVVAVMSGHFLQRGEPAIVNKWARTEMALKMGADVVIELPVAFAMQPAEYFAYGAISALHLSGVVDSICFGSESGQLTPLYTLAQVLHHEPESFQTILEQQLKTGVNYPTAYAAAVQQLAQTMPELADIDVDLLTQPNNNLGLHYLISLRRWRSQIQPHIVVRHKAGYHDPHIHDTRIASATALRRIIFEQQDKSSIKHFIPSYTYNILNEEWEQRRAPMHWDRFVPHLMRQLLLFEPEEIAQFYEVSEGLEHRLCKILPQLEWDQRLTLELIMQHLKTKRYTRTKLQRMLMRIALNHTKSVLTPQRLQQGVPYLRILGFSERGRTLLRKMKTTAQVPIITNVARQPLTSQTGQAFLQMDIRATALYASHYPQPTRDEIFRDYYQAPLRFTGN